MRPFKLVSLACLVLALACSGSDTTSEPADDGGGNPPPPPPPPPPPQPSVQILIEEGFEDNSLAARGWYDIGTPTTTTAERKNGNGSLQIHFNLGALVSGLGGMRRLFTPTESLYISYWVKYSGNWQGSGRPYHPHEFSFLTNVDSMFSGPAYSHLTAYVEHNYQNGGIPSVALQDGRNVDESRIGQNLTGVTENRAVAGCNGSTDGYPDTCYLNGAVHVNGKTWLASAPAFLPNPGPGYKGDWNFVEAYFQLNTIQNGVGQTNGIIRYWFNGQLVLNLTNVLLRTGAHPAMRFNQLLVLPYIGDGSPVDQSAWVDDLRIATGRP